MTKEELKRIEEMATHDPDKLIAGPLLRQETHIRVKAEAALLKMSMQDFVETVLTRELRTRGQSREVFGGGGDS